MPRVDLEVNKSTPLAPGPKEIKTIQLYAVKTISQLATVVLKKDSPRNSSSIVRTHL